MGPLMSMLVGGGLSALGELLGGNNAGSGTMQAAGLNADLLKRFGPDVERLIRGMTGSARGQLVAPLRDMKAFTDMGRRGSNLYADATGINGGAGSARAAAAFKAGPGYDFTLNQGLDALERRASARGALDSGQTSLDTLNYATGLADQTYNSWLDRLGGFTNQWASGLDRSTGQRDKLADLNLGSLDRILSARGGVLSGLLNNNSLAAQGQEAKDAERSDQFSNIFSGLGRSFGNYAGGFGGGARMGYQ